MESFLSLLLIYPLCLLSVLLHEAGHALAYRIGGGRARGKLTVGSGPALADGRRFSLRLLPVGGSFMLEDDAGLTKKQALFMLAGGPLVSLALAGLFAWLRFGLFAASDGLPLRVTAFLLFFNFFQFLFTAIPVRYRLINRGMPSDGKQFIYVLKQKDTE